MPQLQRISVHKVIDRNSFDRVLVQRAFTDHNEGDKWATAQAQSIKSEFMSLGEDLVDIETEWYHLWLDHDEVVTGYKRPIT